MGERQTPRGWVSWSELATLLVELSDVVTVSMRRLLVPSLIGRTDLTR